MKNDAADKIKAIKAAKAKMTEALNKSGKPKQLPVAASKKVPSSSTKPV